MKRAVSDQLRNDDLKIDSQEFSIHRCLNPVLFLRQGTLQCGYFKHIIRLETLELFKCEQTFTHQQKAIFSHYG
jgi:hypothetical protein